MVGHKQQITPPYISYVTFRNTIQCLALEGRLPRQIDRTVLGTMSGAGQKQFIAALRFFELIDDRGAPDEKMAKLARATDAEWKDYMGTLLKERYPNEIEQLEDASPKTFRESFVSSFEGIGSSLIEPGIRFLVAAAKDCGLSVSAHLSKRKVRAANPPKRKPKKHIQQTGVRDLPSNAAADESESSAEIALLNKFPDFDPSWTNEQQKMWFSAYERLLGICSKNGQASEQ